MGGRVVLLHGLHMHAWAMQPLAWRLQQQGFKTACFGYQSVLESVAAHSERLARWLVRYQAEDEALFLVGHSLGGLVIRHFLYRYPQVKIRRCVTIGTPHQGSFAARRLREFVPSVLGRSYTLGLDGQVPPLPEGVALGSIAGSASRGLGRLILSSRDKDNDGTVFVYETRVAKACDEIVLPVSHSGMLLDWQVAQQTGYFLRHGCFNHGDAVAG